MKFREAMFNIKHAGFMAQRYAQRYAEQAYIFARSSMYTFGFIIPNFGPVLIRQRVARNVKFWWYDNRYGNLVPMSFMFHSRLTYDFTERTLIKDTTWTNPTHEQIANMFENAIVLTNPTREQLTNITNQARANRRAQRLQQAQAVNAAAFGDIVTIDDTRFRLERLVGTAGLFLITVDQKYNEYRMFNDDGDSKDYIQHVRKGLEAALGVAVWDSRKELVDALIEGNYTIE